jgi:hypothetical protein
VDPDDYDADPDSAFHFIADPAFQNDANSCEYPVPQQFNLE